MAGTEALQPVGWQGVRGMDNPAQWEGLASRIKGGNCVLVLGPGASTISSGDQEVPAHVAFARQLAVDIGKQLSKEQRRDLNTDDLRHVSQIWQEIKRNSALLQLMCERFYKQYSGETTEFHRNIAALPFQICLSTTPDDFLFDAMTEAGKTPVRNFYNFKKSRDFRGAEFNVERPLIYHLYGHPQDSSSLVITENDLIEFLTNVVRKSPPLPEQITGILSHPDSTCLFVDLGFKNWYLRVLMRSLGLVNHNEKSVALESPEFFAQSKQHQAMLYFSAGNTMEFRQDSLSDFAARLRSAYESIAGPHEEAIPEPPATAPIAFLSYASEDRDLVERLSQAMKAGGIAVWMDRQNLRGGDNWERVITHVIEKQVDYFIPVQAMGMTRDEGVFYQEIKMALLRQDRMRDGIKFVVPVHTESRFRLERLHELNSIPIATDDGVSELVHDILEDWGARKALHAGSLVGSFSN
jgi:hypothetical protein